jgi:hypothetical protein
MALDYCLCLLVSLGGSGSKYGNHWKVVTVTAYIVLPNIRAKWIVFKFSV